MVLSHGYIDEGRPASSYQHAHVAKITKRITALWYTPEYFDWILQHVTRYMKIFFGGLT